ncbi:class I SAM-dependent DNA methyltransferase [Ruminococcus gauvreauii]|uniref:Class I SAM-dependent methyltransferase n=1 Tax=Ruminococcus gauvreauii TaxID=438033 RepID=A0ABY5VJG5_9FIRM|nr:class I SAM-dependent methyltransferase [Ruminococcus gauvreauii]UWP60313.1 class I SAM-dependent methyltransferase [Ruminococcus gauvreauii]
METYRSFAQVYDMFMDDIDYDAWSIYLIGLLREYGVNEGLVLELGCGTGSMTQRLAASGYDMIGVDLSDDMLEIAQEKKIQSGLEILYLQQDMRGFELYGTVRAVVSVCDSLNYILEDEELLGVFSLVNNYLDPGGVFVFDLNTVYKYETLMGEQTIAENREEASFIWDNYYDRESMRNEYELAIFIPEGAGGLYRKYEEVHYQRAYPLPRIIRLLEQAGMEFVTAYDAFTRDQPEPESERICVIAREHGK